MSPAAAKLLMCVCAGSTGAAVVPIAHHARAVFKARPAVHRSVRTPAPPEAGLARSVAAVPCAPALNPATAGIGMPVLASPGIQETAGLATPGNALSGSGSSFSAGGFDGPGGGIPTGSGFTPIGGIGAPNSVPSASPAPEVATWSMIVAGTGIVGGTLRYRRRHALSS